MLKSSTVKKPSIALRYKDVIRILLERSSNPANVPDYDPLRPKRHNEVPFVRHVLERLGHTQSNLRRLNMIHVAGTKGKGSTSRLLSAFLETYHARRNIRATICTVTGPHLLSCTERIQINGKSISKEAFAESFSQVYAAATRPPLREDGPQTQQLIALTAIHYAASQGVDYFVCEAFCGGTRDATNVFDSPMTTVITKLGMDHVHLLGPSLADIARNKAGIMRTGTVCVTCDQPPEALAVLKNESQRLSAPLDVVTDDPFSSVTKTLPTIAHRTNAAIAIRVANHVPQRSKESNNVPAFNEEDVVEGLKICKNPGSFQEVAKGPCHFHLDTAHNSISLPIALDWFEQKASALKDRYQSRGFRVVIYSHAAKLEGMDNFQLVLDSLEGDRKVDLLIVTPLVGRNDGTNAAERITARANTGKDTLKEMSRRAQSQKELPCVQIAQSVEHALQMAKQHFEQSADSSHLSCLVTGSGFLVAEATALLND